MTDNCANPKCGKELIHIKGRKKKKYCDANCKLADWQRLNPVKKEPKVKMIPIKEWEDIQKKITENKLVEIAENATKNSIPSEDFKKEVYKVEENNVKIKTAAPRNLDELKALCPKDLTGFDKSNWIRTERQKYGI